jgi:hypothetical protein
MKKFAFISRHVPTQKQQELAAEKDIDLIAVGDVDAFTITPGMYMAFDGVVVVHPAAALRLCAYFPVGVFENGSRPVEGGASSFVAVALHIY